MTIKPFWPLSLVILIILNACEVDKETVTPEKYAFLVGTYTETDDEGINYLVFDPENRTLEAQVIGKGIKNPSFLVSNKKRDRVFTVEETGGENGGRVKSFQFDEENRDLKLISSASTQGDSPCYLSLGSNEELLFVGNYSGGNLAAFQISDDGALDSAQVIQHEGQSIIKSRQSNPHVHSVVVHPKEDKLFVGDLGTDKVNVYTIQSGSASVLTKAKPAYFEVSPGAGPRHLVFNHEGDRFYLIHELTAELGIYAYEEGDIKHLQTLPLTSPTFSGDVGAAEVRLSPDEKFVYASNRGDANEISVFKINKQVDKAELIQIIPSGGKTPRNFNFTYDGKWILVANQDSNDITVFERDDITGLLKMTEIKTKIPKPVYLFAIDQ
ncbi:lactonase family protein [Pararhodonellum marinum]|uniref:lactonase family protein n=1 Tax=Pararhodonellum marinum TaxID=2755358 RepID=UPI00188DEAC2|nr:lactonase family protein [Pararhodonellum marinum]